MGVKEKIKDSILDAFSKQYLRDFFACTDEKKIEDFMKNSKVFDIGTIFFIVQLSTRFKDLIKNRNMASYLIPTAYDMFKDSVFESIIDDLKDYCEFNNISFETEEETILINGEPIIVGHHLFYDLFSLEEHLLNLTKNRVK